MSRIRQIKPSFFKDPDIAALPVSVRLFYIGFWTLCDDAGYYRWDVAEVGIELFGFESRGKRERMAVEYRDRLIEAGRIQTFPDCHHLFVPTFTVHQRFAGPTKRVLTYEREHLKCVPPRAPAGPRGNPPIPANPRPGIGMGTGKGTERNGSEQEPAAPLAPDGAAPREGESESDFMARTGLSAAFLHELAEARA